MRDTFLLAALFLVGSLLLLGGTLSPATAHVAADTIYVDTGASGAGDGSFWTDAYTSVQDALGEARSNGEEDDVWVTGGTYYPDEGASVQPDDRTESFRVESGIDLHGHFSGDEDGPADRNLARGGPKTILSGEIQQDGSASNNAYTVLRLKGGSAGNLHIEGRAATVLERQFRRSRLDLESIQPIGWVWGRGDLRLSVAGAFDPQPRRWSRIVTSSVGV